MLSGTTEIPGVRGPLFENYRRLWRAHIDNAITKVQLAMVCCSSCVQSTQQSSPGSAKASQIYFGPNIRFFF